MGLAKHGVGLSAVEFAFAVLGSFGQSLLPAPLNWSDLPGVPGVWDSDFVEVPLPASGLPILSLGSNSSESQEYTGS